MLEDNPTTTGPSHTYCDVSCHGNILQERHGDIVNVFLPLTGVLELTGVLRELGAQPEGKGEVSLQPVKCFRPCHTLGWLG